MICIIENNFFLKSVINEENYELLSVKNCSLFMHLNLEYSTFKHFYTTVLFKQTLGLLQ